MLVSHVWQLWGSLEILSCSTLEGYQVRNSAVGYPRGVSVGQCRWDNCPLYELPTESSLGAQSILKLLTLIQHSFGHTKSDVETSGAET